MRKPQHAPGIPNLADQGNPNVPLVGKQQFVLNHVYISELSETCCSNNLHKIFLPQTNVPKKKSNLQFQIWFISIIQKHHFWVSLFLVFNTKCDQKPLMPCVTYQHMQWFFPESFIICNKFIRKLPVHNSKHNIHLKSPKMWHLLPEYIEKLQTTFKFISWNWKWIE